jgi:predicted lipoprotein with Yx(FWY)xxD motif
MSKRLRRLVLGSVIATAVAVPAIAVAATTTTLTTHSVKRGTVVASPSGLTLYGFVADDKTSTSPHTSTCFGSCAVVWPPLIAKGTLKVASKSGLNPKLLGRVKRSNGVYQVTYGGHPLYRYIADKKPGQSFGQNVFQSGAKWYVIGKNGNYLKPVGSGLIGGY